jgi:alpha-L-fucosidase 2
MNVQKKIFFCIIIMFVGNLQLLKSENQPLKLWYNQPASELMKSLPLGNGRIGAMVFGGIQKETIALNEITMWAGKVDPDQEHIAGNEKLREIREYFFKGELEKGNEAAKQILVGKPNSFGTHLPVGNLHLQFNYPEGKIQNYYRDLNLDNAVASVIFNKGGVKYTREFLSSNPDGVLVVKLSASKKAALNFSVSLDLIRKAEIMAKDNVLEFAGDLSKEPTGGVAFLGNIRIKTEEGTVTANDKSLNVSNATIVYIFVDIRTNFQKKTDFKAVCRNTTENASNKIYEELKAKHIAD